MPKSLHFKVDNGDMTFIEFESGRRLLIDIKIRGAADDPDDETPDVGSQLRERLARDGSGRLYVDAFLLTHPDQDHCGGLQEHFHLGPLSDWKKSDDKIIIREMWSSPIIFRRAERKDHILCEDAKAWAKEARRRVALYRNQKFLNEGDRILVLGEDVEGKTDDLAGILVKAGAKIPAINGNRDYSFDALLLAPLVAASDEEEETLTKNNSSVVMRLTVLAQGVTDAAKYLFGGDAEVAIWEKIWDRYAPDDLSYDVLLAPHHCSWHSLSWDSWSKKRELVKVSDNARSALSQAQFGATILSSSCAIEDDDNDPPCIRAKREYLAIVKKVSGVFMCLADDAGDQPAELDISQFGPKLGRKRLAAVAGISSGVGSEALAHG